MTRALHALRPRPVARAFVALLLIGCAPDGGEVAVRELSVDDYPQVHPVLEARCATLDCHGDMGRALRLYAETGLRAADDLRGTPITTAELAANVRSIAALDDEILLGKPLAGHLHHVGGDIWLQESEPQAECFTSFLSGTIDPTACTTATAEVALPP